MIDPQPTFLNLTDAAASKLREMTKEESNPDVGLRVYVYSGGCSGFRYGMMIEDAPTAEDSVLQANGVRSTSTAKAWRSSRARDRLHRHADGRRLHRQQPERGQRLRLRLELPDRGGRGQPAVLLPLGRSRSSSPTEAAGRPGGFAIAGRQAASCSGARLNSGSMEIPLFPLRTVLCPGIAMPLHIFEPRYRLMIDRCIEESQPVRDRPDPRGPRGRAGATWHRRRSARSPRSARRQISGRPVRPARGRQRAVRDRVGRLGPGAVPDRLTSEARRRRSAIAEVAAAPAAGRSAVSSATSSCSSRWRARRRRDRHPGRG